MPKKNRKTLREIRCLPQIASPEPQTANPKPQTANPKPQTANPTPQTANRKPSILVERNPEAPTLMNNFKCPLLKSWSRYAQKLGTSTTL